MDSNETPVWMTFADTYKRWLMSKSKFFYLMRNDKDFPARFRFGKRDVRLKLVDVERYEQSRVEPKVGGH